MNVCTYFCPNQWNRCITLHDSSFYSCENLLLKNHYINLTVAYVEKSEDQQSHHGLSSGYQERLHQMVSQSMK